MIPFIGGLFKAVPGQRTLAWLILWTISIYRFVSIKIENKYLYNNATKVEMNSDGYCPSHAAAREMSTTLYQH